MNTHSYSPSQEESSHIQYVYQRKSEMREALEARGLISDWEEAEKLYRNEQKKVLDGEFPALNMASEIEMIETKTSEEIKILPEVVLVPKQEKDRIKVEALQKVVEHVNNKNRIKLLLLDLFFKKNIYGTAYLHTYYKETYRTVKFIDDIKIDKHGNKKLHWREKKVVDYKDICKEVLKPTDVLFDENAQSIDEAIECIMIKYFDISTAENLFSEYSNFSYVKAGKYSSEITSNYQTWEYDCEVVYYWHKNKDEMSIVVNGVLLTEIGAPILETHKLIPFCRAISRFMPNTFYPKGDVQLIKPLKRMKNILINAIIDGVRINANAPLVAVSDVARQLENFEWQNMNVLEVKNADDARSVFPLKVDANVVGALSLLQKIEEYMVIITGVDPRVLITQVQETATRTSLRRDSAMKRINMGLSFIEQETLYRDMKLTLSLIKQFYQETQKFPKKGEEHLDAPTMIEEYRNIPVQDKRYTWKDKTSFLPFSSKEIDFLKNNTGEWIVSWLEDHPEKSLSRFTRQWNSIEADAKYQSLPTSLKRRLENLYKKYSRNYSDLESQDIPGVSSNFEIRPELFDVDYDFEIRGRSEQSTLEVLSTQKIQQAFPQLMANPLINKELLTQKYLESLQIAGGEGLLGK